MTQKPKKRAFFKGAKIQKMSRGASMPPAPLETCSFGARLGNWPVFIRSASETILCRLSLRMARMDCF